MQSPSQARDIPKQQLEVWQTQYLLWTQQWGFVLSNYTILIPL